MNPSSLFSLTDHLERLSKDGDPLEVLGATVDFEYFRGWLIEGLGYGDGSKGGRPPFDPVSMFKALILQAQHNLSDARMEFMIRDRLSWMRFLGFDLGGPTPDENTIRHFRNRLTETGTLKRVMKAFDWQLHKNGYIPMSGQIVDASLIPAPKQRNTEDEKRRSRRASPPRKSGLMSRTRLRRKIRTRASRRYAPQTPAGQWLDAEDWRQSALSPGWHAPADDRGAGVRLQEPHQRRPAVRFHPRSDGHIGLRGGWAATQARRQHRQHRLRGLG